jgi:hypothetical protein
VQVESTEVNHSRVQEGWVRLSIAGSEQAPRMRRVDFAQIEAGATR